MDAEEAFAWFILACAVILPLSYVAGSMAEEKGRSFSGFFWLSMLLSPIVGLAAAASVSESEAKRQARELSEGKLRLCPHCLSAIPPLATACRFCTRSVDPIPLAEQPAEKPIDPPTQEAFQQLFEEKPQPPKGPICPACGVSVVPSDARKKTYYCHKCGATLRLSRATPISA